MHNRIKREQKNTKGEKISQMKNYLTKLKKRVNPKINKKVKNNKKK